MLLRRRSQLLGITLQRLLHAHASPRNLNSSCVGLMEYCALVTKCVERAQSYAGQLKMTFTLAGTRFLPDLNSAVLPSFPPDPNKGLHPATKKLSFPPRRPPHTKSGICRSAKPIKDCTPHEK